MRLEGSLDAFSLPDIFALLSMTKKTGGLHLRRDGAHGVVWLTSGSLTGGASASGRQALLRRVVSAADVGADALQAAVDRARSEGVGIVTALLRDGAVAEARLQEIAGEHVVDTVFDLLRWDSGDFEFVVDEPDRDPVGVVRAVDEVVAEARRRLEDWNSVRDGLPGPATVLQVASAPAGVVTLEPEQWALMVLADGRRSVVEIVELSGRGEYAVVRSLADLVRAGVLCEATTGESSVGARLRVLASIDGLPTASAVPTASVAPDAPDAASLVVPDVADSALGSLADFANDNEADEVHEIREPTRTDEADQDDDGDDWEPAAEDRPAARVPARLRSAGSSDGPDVRRVTPQRPEPFLPSRTPEHPDGSMATSTVGALAAATAPASQIERDPSVNKSLLLRLIAGVRGL